MIFVDTAAFLAIENRRDAHHEDALAFRDASLRAGETFITSDYVLDESYTIIRLRAGHAVAVKFGEDVRASGALPTVRPVPCTTLNLCEASRTPSPSKSIRRSLARHGAHVGFLDLLA